MTLGAESKGVNAQAPLTQRWTDRRAWITLCCLCLLLWLTLFQVYDGGQFIDPFNHIVYLTSLTHDRDLDFANDIIAANTFDRQRVQELGRLGPTGLVENNWPPGPALLWAPVHVPFQLIAQGLGWEFPRFGFAPMLVISLTTSLWGLLAIWVLYRLVRLRHRPAPAAAAVAVVLACSPLPFHLLRMPASSHGFATLTVALWLWMALRPWGAHPARRGLWLGLAGGLMILVRWQNAVFGLAGILAMLPRLAQLHRRSSRDLWAALALSAVGLMAMVGIQMAIWRITYGHWIASPHGSGYLHWGRPVFAALLLSGKGGMLHWHPAMAIGAVGLIALTARRPWLGVGLWISLLLHLYICAAVDDWHGEWGVGNRRLCALLPLLALGMAEVFAGIRSRGVAVLLTSLLVVLALGNWLFMIFGYRGQIGIFSPLNQGGWSTLVRFWQPLLAEILARPHVALIDNAMFTPMLDAGRRPGLMLLGLVAMAMLPLAWITLRRLAALRSLQRWTGPALVMVLFAVQVFLLTGLRRPSEGVRETGSLAQRLRGATPAQAREVGRVAERLMLENALDPAVFHLMRGVAERARQIAGDAPDPDLTATVPERWLETGIPLDKWALHRLLESGRGSPPGEVLDLCLTHVWDQRLMQPLFTALIRESDAQRIRTYLDRTDRTPVLWWSCQWYLDSRVEVVRGRTEPQMRHPAGALLALRHLRSFNPLDLETLDQLIQTERALAGERPELVESARRHERLARAITDWELARIRGALESPLYERAFLQDRLGYFLAKGYGSPPGEG